MRRAKNPAADSGASNGSALSGGIFDNHGSRQMPAGASQSQHSLLGSLSGVCTATRLLAGIKIFRE